MLRVRKKLFCSLYRKCKILFYIRLMSVPSAASGLFHEINLLLIIIVVTYLCIFLSHIFPDQRSLITQKKHQRTRKENRTHQANIAGVNTVNFRVNVD